MSVLPLPPEKLYARCDPDTLKFSTTAALDEARLPLGQERAAEAVRFGITMESFGYNLFCLGGQGTGKVTLLKEVLKKTASDRPVPDDWCYVYNFEEAHRPKALRLPAGMADGFKEDMEKFLSEAQDVIPETFEGEDYQNRRALIEEQYKDQKEDYFAELQKKAVGKSVALLRMPVGLVVAPMKDGEVLSPEDFEGLPEDDKKQIMAELAEVEEELGEAVQDAPKWERELREKLQGLTDEIAGFTVTQLMKDLFKKYKAIPDVLAYLEAVHDDMVENIEDFIEEEEEEGGNPLAALMQQDSQPEEGLRRYKVNVIVRQDAEKGAPVVFEDHPIQPNLTGRIERLQQFGALITDFNLIKPGALHRANGGYLVLEARKLLMHDNAWEALKRALRSKRIRIESMAQENATFSTISIDPEPIPLDLKIILVGDPNLYYLLSSMDPDFCELFKVEADFTSEMPRTLEHEDGFSQRIGSFARREKLRSLNNTAVARVIEHASRLAEDGEKLTTHMASIADLVREANYFAKQSNANIIGRNHVIMALDAQEERSGRIREQMMEQIERNSILIDTDGEKTGQINGLVVYDIGRFSFGRPARISCQVRMGKGDVVDIEREVHLSGPIHSKGVLILSSYLGNKFAQDFPLSLDASLVFEQSYGGVDGDSASLAELICLLSSLADTPIKQSLAITGSVNQFGETQPIGGVNEKIEGFFEICKRRGLDGTHGAVIPTSNVRNLMLKDEIVEACENGQFHVYAVETVEEALEVLMGVPAGVMDEEAGRFPPGTINSRVQRRLYSFFDKAQRIEAQKEGYPAKRFGA